MPHQLLGRRFFEYNPHKRVTAWHGLGIALDEKIPALQVMHKLGEVVVTREPVLVELPGGRLIDVPGRYVLLRHPVPEDDQYVPCGVVTEDYELVSHVEAAGIWDQYVGRYIQTMGFLYGGRAMFISTPLQDIDVRGEEVKLNLALVNWIDGTTANLVMVTGVCPVCANTVRLGEELATERLRLVHDSNMRIWMGVWLRDAVRRAETRVADISKACGLMSAYPMYTPANPRAHQEMTRVLEAAYPDPPEPRTDCAPGVLRQRYERYEFAKHAVQQRRLAAVELFAGAGTGIDLESRKGTLWGLYQSVAQLEDRRRGAGEPRSMTSVMLGARGQTIDRAFDAAYAIVSRN
jgi:hypothetical protein